MLEWAVLSLELETILSNRSRGRGRRRASQNGENPIHRFIVNYGI